MNTKKQDIQRVEPTITIQENHYKVCSLNFSADKKEFYYHFAYCKGTKNKFYNYNSQKIIGRPDHITFHQDGTVQLRLKDDDLIIGKNKMPDATFIPPNNDIITPLLIHSIYQNNGEYCLPLPNNKLNNNVWARSRDFSVIIFLTPEKISQDNLLSKISHLLGFPAGRVIVWDGWAIDYVLTDLTLQLPLGTQPNPYYSAFAYADLHLIFNDLLMQRIR